MKQIAIQDANILIDLLMAGMFNHCLALQYQFCTTDIILDELYEEQVGFIKPHIYSGKFYVITISPEELEQIAALANANRLISPEDWSAIYFAEQKAALLLSGDGAVREIATARKLTVCGTLWILDQLVGNDILPTQQAAVFLKALLDKKRRLPVSECQARLKLWSGP